MLARGLGWHDAHLLGGRQIVIRMFGDEGDYVLVEQAKQVAAWMGKERVHVEEEFTGE
jgi:Mg-chelatase subunit ChlI